MIAVQSDYKYLTIWQTLMSNRMYATPFSVLQAVSLLSHKSRLSKFNQAIKQIVDSKSYVIDIGTGTGILAMIAARAGARKVTAIDVNHDSIIYAMKAAQLNGLNTSIDFLESHYEDFHPNERADVVVCEMLSSMMLIEQQIPACSHAVKYFLKKDGIILPNQVSIFAVPVESFDLWHRFEIEGFSFPKVPQTIDPTQYKDLGNLTKMHTFDLTVENNGKIREYISFKVREDGIIHGLVGMFESQLYDELILNMEDGWRDLYMPLENPLHVKKDEKILFNIEFIPGNYDTLFIEAET